MKRKILATLALVVGSSGLVFLAAAPAFASTNYNNLIDDQVFNTTSSMTASQIDSFLNSFSGSCISENNGFAAPDPIGYNPSQGFLYGSNVSAGRVIYDAASAYDLNPQVLLATLQKEQSLVTGGAGCSNLAYIGAVGYNCPDGGTEYSYSSPGDGSDFYSTGNHFDSNGNASGGSNVTSVSNTCVDSSMSAGFSQQIIHATWLLKFDEERAEGNTTWAIISGAWNNTDDLSTCYYGYMVTGSYARCPGGSTTYYDGDATIDSTAVTVGDGATAALYDYTPHLSGNNNFVTIFDSWFGSTYTPAFAWQEVGMSIMDTGENASIPTDYVHSGERLYVELTVQNIGSATWYNNGANPLDLGTVDPQNTTTSFCDTTWMSCDRPATLSESSVAPGGTGHFYFYIAVPNDPGVHKQYFEPVAEGQSWMSNGSNYSIYADTTQQYDWQWLYYNAYTDSSETTPVDINNLARNEQVYIVLSVKNESPVFWNNSGPYPTDLGTSDPQDGQSILCTTGWMSCNRPAKMDQTSVAPGGTATFSFYVKTPSTIGTYREYFKPVVENSGWSEDNYNQIYLNVTH
jgi:hypothetical protein